MAYSKYTSATEITTGTITAEHDALWVGANTGGSGKGGELKVTMADDTTAVMFKGVADGEFLPIEVKEIVAADTGCSAIVALESGERWST